MRCSRRIVKHGPKAGKAPLEFCPSAGRAAERNKGPVSCTTVLSNNLRLLDLYHQPLVYQPLDIAILPHCRSFGGTDRERAATSGCPAHCREGLPSFPLSTGTEAW